MLRKTKFLNISVLVSEVVIFIPKRKVLYEFLQKCFKTTERNSLAVCSSVYGESIFLFIFIHFYWFDQKEWFKQIHIFLIFAPFQNDQKNKLSEYFRDCF